MESQYPFINDQPAPDDLAEQIEQLLNVVDRSMSTYREDSEISTFNQIPPHQQQTISNEFAQVLSVSQQVWQQTNGAFDPTVGPLVDLWGFGPVPTDDVVPDDSLIQLALENVGFGSVVLDASTLIKTKSLSLDLSAVAKGYAVDQVAGSRRRGAASSTISTELMPTAYHESARPGKRG